MCSQFPSPGSQQSKLSLVGQSQLCGHPAIRSMSGHPSEVTQLTISVVLTLNFETSLFARCALELQLCLLCRKSYQVRPPSQRVLTWLSAVWYHGVNRILSNIHHPQATDRRYSEKGNCERIYLDLMILIIIRVLILSYNKFMLTVNIHYK